ncbi:MAG: NAD(P)/FAD-dependent oxidoreductase [Candidatus Magasanikbacteria bacterium]
MSDIQTDVAILGGGIAGLEAFRSLKKKFKKQNINKEITLIDKNNYFTFVPLLHEVATGAVDPPHATLQLRELTYKSRHKFRQARVSTIFPKEKEVETNIGTIRYDRCVLALGSVTNFCGVEGAKENTHHVRSLEEALELKSILINKLEQQQDKLHINIVGGGYIGVEIAAEIAQLKQDDFKKLYPETNMKVQIFEVQDTIMCNMSEKVQNKVKARLNDLGVEIHTKVSANKVTDNQVKLSNNEQVPNDITIWSTGFTTQASKYLPKKYLKEDRVPTNEHLQHLEFKSLYPIGDIALIKDPKTKEVYPQLGEASHKEGEYIARQITSEITDNDIEQFTFKSKGRLMPVGEWYGVAVFPWLNDLKLFGKLAWWLRRTAYVLFMPGVVRKIRIVIDWTLRTFGFRNLTNISPKVFKND